MPNRQLLKDIQKRQRELRMESINPDKVEDVMRIKESYVRKTDLEDFKDAMTRLIAKMSQEIDALTADSKSGLADIKKSISRNITSDISRIRVEFLEKITSIEDELGTSLEDIENLRNSGGAIPKGLIEKINSFVVQRSVNIPVTVDQGGTGATTLSQAKTNLGVNIVSSGEYLSFGDSGTDGSYRIYISGDNLVIERRESGSWVEKGAYLP